MGPRRIRRPAAVAGVAALVALALGGCAAAPPSPQLTRCMPGTWTLDVDAVADGMGERYAASGTPVFSFGGAGTQTLTVARDLHVQIDSALSWVAAGTRDGATLVIEQDVDGTRTAEARLIGRTISFDRVEGMLDERMTAEHDGIRSRHHYRVPSTAFIGRPGTVRCTADRLTVERIEGVPLEFIRAG